MHVSKPQQYTLLINKLNISATPEAVMIGGHSSRNVAAPALITALLDNYCHYVIMFWGTRVRRPRVISSYWAGRWMALGGPVDGTWRAGRQHAFLRWYCL
ncbi:unnamed protein product [Colias eurytheme]|nr:unnamed protein product [Colias eurytheme]